MVHQLALDADLREHPREGVLPAALGDHRLGRGVTFWGESKGVFTSSVITAFLAAASSRSACGSTRRLQKFCFYGGVLGLLIVFGSCSSTRRRRSSRAFNHHAQSTYNATTPDAYAQTLKKGGYDGAGSLGGLAFGSTSC